MSTRMTLWYSEEFHLYQEAFDNDNVYLEIKSPQFESLVLTIPLAAWKGMRQHTIEPSERYLDLSDHELREEAERAVDEHRTYLESLGDSRLKSVAGMLVYGPAEASRDEMIRRFVSYYRPTAVADLLLADD